MVLKPPPRPHHVRRLVVESLDLVLLEQRIHPLRIDPASPAATVTVPPHHLVGHQLTQAAVKKGLMPPGRCRPAAWRIIEWHLGDELKQELAVRDATAVESQGTEDQSACLL